MVVKLKVGLLRPGGGQRAGGRGAGTNTQAFPLTALPMDSSALLLSSVCTLVVKAFFTIQRAIFIVTLHSPYLWQSNFESFSKFSSFTSNNL